MDLDFEIDKCIQKDNVAELNLLLANNPHHLIMPLILDKVWHIGIHGAVAIFNLVFSMPEVVQHLTISPKRSFLDALFRCSKEPLIIRVLQIPLFRDEVIAEPLSVLKWVAQNRNCAPQILAKLNVMFDIKKLFDTSTQNDLESIWLAAYLNYNYSAMNALLEFPKIYAMVDAIDPSYSDGSRHINTKFMEYYFDKLSKRDRNQEFSEQETLLGFMILKTLMITYPDREKIKEDVKSWHEFEKRSSRSNTLLFRASLAAKRLSDKYFSDDADVHFERIMKLVCIKSIGEMARNSIVQINMLDMVGNLVLAKNANRRRVLVLQ